MPHKLRKTRKMRGSRTVGYGRVGQHRDQGSKGYRKSGRHKAGWSWVQRYDPDYFGKDGFTSPKSLRQKVNVINQHKNVGPKTHSGRIPGKHPFLVKYDDRKWQGGHCRFEAQERVNPAESNHCIHDGIGFADFPTEDLHSGQDSIGKG